MSLLARRRIAGDRQAEAARVPADLRALVRDLMKLPSDNGWNLSEDEAAYETPDHALVSVPRELVPAVRQFIAKHSKWAWVPTACD